MEFALKMQSRNLNGGAGKLIRPPDLTVFRLSKWISSNPESNFALKIHLICPETQFSQTPGGATAPP